MTRCSDDHPPIDHAEFHCPLCAAITDLRQYAAALDLVLTSTGCTINRHDEVELPEDLIPVVQAAQAATEFL